MKTVSSRIHAGEIRLVVGALVFTLACSAGAASAEEEQEVVEIRGTEMPVWPADELRERGLDVPDVPRGENAAWVYLEAGNGYLDLPNDLADAFDYAVRTAWPQDHRELRQWLSRKENREARQAASRASRMQCCQMPYFGDPDGSIISVLLPTLRHHRMLAKLLVADGRRLAAQKDYLGAMENYATAMRMGHHVAEGITLIEALVGVACWEVGRRAACDLAVRHDLSKQDLAAVLEQWNELLPLMPSLQRGFEGERYMGPTIVDEIVSRPTHLLRNLQGMSSLEMMPGQVRSRDGWDRLEARLGRVFLPDRTIKNHMLEYYDAVLKTSRLPYHDERVQGFNEQEYVAGIPRWDVLSRCLLPSLSRARLVGERCRTQTRATTIALALQRHARENRGGYPAELIELESVPDPDELVDPFSGREFAYTRSPGGWKLYSVGPDRTDNGGKPGDRWDEQGTDLIVVFPPDPVEPFDATAE